MNGGLVIGYADSDTTPAYSFGCSSSPFVGMAITEDSEIAVSISKLGNQTVEDTEDDGTVERGSDALFDCSK